MVSAAPHTPVMPDEALAYLNVRPGGRYIDCTAGAGGHSAAILEASAPDGRLLANDADPAALAVARARLAGYGDRVRFSERYFDEIADAATAAGVVPADGLLCDLGVSSLQLDTPERGFSFRESGPLDMRMSPAADLTAAAIVNEYEEADLADLLYRLGDERRSRRIARQIVARRPLATTTDLAKAVEQAAGKGRKASTSSRVHPATKTFLALRMAVNQELRRLGDLLALARSLLGFGSRLVIISFHSLEDRLVKQFLRDASQGDAPAFRVLTRKVARPSAAEVERNPRSRSARLRAAEAR
ncbi:MAG: 16S rRNA (cytosine(1402)-N(4))-methyltransferase RsmH [Chloroflexi bacterium]|nr:16S rRNA (cytosine(1402)-N(4))-methyltransferase RsmH [Chloroflexota bacterium]